MDQERFHLIFAGSSLIVVSTLARVVPLRCFTFHKENPHPWDLLYVYWATRTLYPASLATGMAILGYALFFR